MLQVEIHSFQEEDFKEILVSLTEVFKGDWFPLAEKMQNEHHGSHSVFYAISSSNELPAIPFFEKHQNRL